jgi:uncharacterized protein
MDFYLFIGLLAGITGFFSGMLGIGGGIIMAPLLLFMPQLFGFQALEMHTVTGLTIVQGLAACICGALVHRKLNFVSPSLTAWMGGTIFIAAFIGGAVAVYTDGNVLLVIFALLAFSASILVFVPTRMDSENPQLGNFFFSRLRAVSASGSVGLLGGMVGQGGSFILIPLMTSYMQVPTRIAIGSNLASVFFSTLAAFLGKALTGQINWLLAIPIVITVIPATYLGGIASCRVKVVMLRRILAVCIAAAALRIGYGALAL